jgi:hypothetical protein
MRLVVLSDDLAHASAVLDPAALSNAPDSESLSPGKAGGIDGETHAYSGITVRGDGSMLYSMDSAELENAAPDSVVYDKYSYNLRVESPEGSILDTNTAELEVELHNASRDGVLRFTDTAGTDDYIVADGSTAGVINAGAGDDVIRAGAGDDMIHGGAGDDIIHAGAGSDIMYGGEGRDLFVFTRADLGAGITFTDEIRDFALGEDNLVLGDLLGTSSQESLDNLLGGAQWNSGDSSLTVDTGSLSMQALFDTNGVTLNIKGENDSLVQTINVDITSGDYSHSAINDGEAARAILLEMIKNNT